MIGSWKVGLLANHIWSFADAGDYHRAGVSSSFIQPFADQQVCALHVRCIAGRQDEAEWSPEDIDKGVDLRRPAATRDANGIGPRPPFAPPAERWALM